MPGRHLKCLVPSRPSCEEQCWACLCHSESFSVNERAPQSKETVAKVKQTLTMVNC